MSKADYTVTVGAVDYGLNDNEGRFDWAGAIPLCPDCRDPLVEFNDPDSKRANADARWSFEFFIRCPSCDWQSDLIEGL